jgi:16S rRNA processing protein RimM
VSSRQDWLLAGRVGPAHGLDGTFRVSSAIPSLLVLGGIVLVADEQRVIDRRAGFDGRVLVRLEGCADRNGAEALHGAELLVPKTAAPALGEDEWWVDDLEGCAVQDGEVAVGVVGRVLALPSCEVLEVARTDGGELLVPLISDAVRTVDVAARVIDVDLAFLGEA